jgi:YVTN family beta-propeller protein
MMRSGRYSVLRLAPLALLALAWLASARLSSGQQPGEGPRGTLVTSNMMDNTATVIDAASGRVLATLPTGEGPHEVAISRGGRWAVVSNYGVRDRPGHSLSLIDLTRVEVARTIDLGGYQRPHGMAFFPGDTLLAVTSEVSQAVLVVDVRDGHVLRTLPTRGRVSHMIAMTPAGDRLFTTNIADGSITRLDVGRGDTTRVIPVARYVEGIAITPDGRTVFVGSNGDSLVVAVDVATSQASDTLRGFGMPYRLATSPNGHLLVVTDPVRATISVYELPNRRRRFLIDVPRDSLVSTAEISGSPSPEGVIISGDSRWAFVTIQGRNRLATVDLESGRIQGYASTGRWSDGVGWSPLARDAAR